MLGAAVLIATSAYRFHPAVIAFRFQIQQHGFFLDKAHQYILRHFDPIGE